MSLRDADGWPRVESRDFPTNRGGLCQKGWTSAELLGSADRLTTPLVRAGRAASLVAASWDEALARVAAEIRRIQAADGPESVAVFGGGGLTNEKAYALGKFARVALGTSNIDYNGRFCMSSAAAAGARAFGIDRGLPFPLPDLAAAGTILLVGSNAAETMPPFTRWLSDQQDNGGALIVVDPRQTPTAQRATLHLQITPGTDLALANGLLHIAIAGGHVDEPYIAARTSGFAEVRRVVAAYWPERVERITGVTVAQQRAAVRLLAGAGRAMVLTARGAEQHSKGTDTVSALINLALALGLPGTAGSGYGCLTGQGNGQGGSVARLPPHRRPGRPRACRGGVGRRPGADPRAGTLGVRVARRARDPRWPAGAAGDGQQCRGVCAVVRPDRAQARLAGFPCGVRPVSVRDGRGRRRGASGRAMGRGVRHDDQPRGPGSAPAAGGGPAARGADRSGGDRRAGPPAGRAGAVGRRAGGGVRGAAAGERGRPG
jgi:assimilatory nitrate reductase catalytic subunit